MKLDKIIQESIDKFINESILAEWSENIDSLDDIKRLLKAFNKNKNLSKDEKRNKGRLKKKAEKAKKGRKKTRKLKNGGVSFYDYDDYERKNKSVSKADQDNIADTIDQKNTDISAVAQSVYPDHTEQGAQSQLRKVLNKERPMTKPVASKLDKMISQGKIAVK